MWLVLCDDLDAAAYWAYDGLCARGVPAEFVPASTMSRAVRWVHRVGPRGATVQVDLPDGRRIDSRSVRGTLNRMTWLRPPPSYAASPDGDYALQELLALYLSLLRCLPGPVLNAPSSQGLSGRMRYPLDWVLLAARAGLASLPYVMSSRDAGDEAALRPPPSAAAVRHAVLVASGRVFGDPVSPRGAAAACQLADLAGVGMLGLRLATTADGTTWFEGADLYPDLRPFGGELLDHLAGLHAPAGGP